MFETLSDLLRWEHPHSPEIISSGILPAGGKLVLAGEEESFKTMFSIYAGFCISLGLPLLGYKTVKTRVCMLQSELTKYVFKSRVEQLVKLHNADLSSADIFFATELDLKLNKPAGLAAVISELKQIRPRLLIIDPLYKVLAADISDWEQMLKLTDGLDYICRHLQCAIWLVHHRRKRQILGGEIINLGTDELIGSSALKDWADTAIFIDRAKDNPDKSDALTIRFAKCRNAKFTISPMHVKFNRKDLSFSLMIS